MIGKAAFFGVLLWALRASAQVPDLGAPPITNYATEEYQASSQNWVAVQDRRGVMYFGNTAGILEFDGQRWQFVPTPGEAATRALAAGPDGTIYFGSVGDLGYLATSPAGKISAISLKEAIPAAERTFNDVWQIESCTDGIYFLTLSRIFRFHDGRMTVLPGRLAPSHACVLNGTLFYLDQEKDICLVDGDKVVPIPQLAGVYNGKGISLAPFGQHEILVGRRTGDFRHIDLRAFWDEASGRYDPTRPSPKDLVRAFPTELDAFLRESDALLYKLVSLGPDSFAVGTFKAGIITFDRAGKIIRAINKDGGLLDNTVLGLMVDRSNNLWAATNLGLSHIELSVPQSMFGTRNGIDGLALSARFHQGRMYVGTFLNLFIQAPSRFTLKDDIPKFVRVKGSPHEIWQLLDVEGDLMAASGTGLIRIQNEAASRVPGSSHALSLGTSRRWPGHLFVGLRDGIEVFQRSSGQWTRVGKMDGVNEKIRNITEDADGDLWLSAEAKGLLRVHFPGKRPTEAVVHRFGPQQGLPGLEKLRACFHEPALYVASPKGLFRANIQPWNTEGSDPTRFVPDLALGKAFSDPPTAISDMVSDGRGGFLFNTAGGVVWAVSGKGGEFQMITQPFQGLLASDMKIYVHPNGGVWLPGKVIYRVDPWASKNYDQSFEVLIRKVVAKNGRLVFGGTHGREGTAIRSQRTMFHSEQGRGDIPNLPFDQNAVSFEFAASFYEKPGTIRFQYLLEGFDKDWSDWTSESHKEYTFLPGGHYCFRVRAKNLYGTLGQEAAFAFRILTPWWLTWWFRWLAPVVGGIAITAGLASIVFRRRLTRLRERNAILQDRFRIAQDFHDGLGQGLAGIMLHLQAAATLDGDSPGGSSVRAAMEIAASTLSEVRGTVESIRPSSIEEGRLGDALSGMVGRIQAAVGTRIQYHPGPIRILPASACLHLYRIVEEAVTNALKHSQADGIDIRLAEAGGWVRISVEDNGQGRQASGVESRGASRGLKGMAERAKLLGAAFAIEDRPGGGTSVKVALPITLLTHLSRFLWRHP